MKTITCILLGLTTVLSPGCERHITPAPGLSRNHEPAPPSEHSPPLDQATVASMPEAPTTDSNLTKPLPMNAAPDDEDTCLGSACDVALLPTRASHPGKQFVAKAQRAIQAGFMHQALDDYLTSCQLGWAHGCHRYGWHLEQNGNLANARNFYKLACREGIEKSCNNLGWIAEQKGHLGDAQNYYSWACLNQHPGSCDNLRRVEQAARTMRAH